MNLPDQPPDTVLEPQALARKERFAGIHTRLQGHSGCVVFALVLLLMGIVLGIAMTAFYAFVISAESARVITTPAHLGNITIQADRSFLTHLVEKNLLTSGLPGTIKNVQVTLVHGDQMTITGDDEFSLLGIDVTRQFIIEVQPYVSACQLQTQVLHANLAGIPVTNFTRVFENRINQQLQMKPTGLPSGFAYCTVGVRTEPQEMFVMYTATPI